MTSEQLAWRIRRHAVEMTHRSEGSHIASALSMADILGVLYARILRYQPEMPRWPERDRLVLSKGHAGLALYAALAECGFFPLEELESYYRNGSRLSGHASHSVPGVECSTGSLGHGLGIAVGMAVAAKQDGKAHRVIAILGDGECNEGSVWEAAQAAVTFGLSNLTVIVDHNHMQSLDFCQRTLSGGTLAQKWRAFGWRVIEVDGHNHDHLQAALTAKATCVPTAVIAHTVKGRGIAFMERDILWHYRFPHDGWEYDLAVSALHNAKPQGVSDPYTPDGIPNAQMPWEESGIGEDHTIGATWHPTWFAPREGKE